MHSGTTLQQSVALGPRTHTQHKWLVSSFVVLLPALKFNLLQGELAHRLVKQLYGLTNKKDAVEQITQHYCQVHHFNGSEPTSSFQSTEPTSQDNGSDNPPELHHKITNSCNNPLELAQFSSHHTQDPAAKVNLSAPPHHPSSHLATRILSTNSVPISSAGSSIKALMEMFLTSLRMKNGTQSSL